MDGRNQSYITYEIEVILYVMLLKNICSVESMQEMVAEFNEDECIKKHLQDTRAQRETISPTLCNN